MTKEQFVDTFLTAIEYSYLYEYIAVAVETRGNKDIEIIINPMCNVQDKLEYYKKAYNDNMVLNTYDGIRIVGVVAVDCDMTIETVELILKGEI